MIIYKITNLINGKIYIGQTRNSLEQRWKGHCKEKRGNSVLHKAIRKYGKDNFSKELIDTANSIDELNDLEQYYIKNMNSMVPFGYNLVSGGGVNKEYSQEARDRMSIAGKLAASKRVSHMLGKRGKLSMHSKAIICIDTGEIFESANIAREALGLSSGMLSEVLTGKREHVKGYRFKFLNPEDEYKSPKKVKKKEVMCLNTKEIFTSIGEAAKHYNLQPSHVGSVARGQRKQTGGFKFEFINKKET